ncbi:putative protein phosphatase 2C 18 [Capsicum annuum]
MDRELRSYTNIDCFCSGTTVVTLVKQGKNLVIGNIGDSRTVLATRGEDDSLTAVQLTVENLVIGNIGDSRAVLATRGEDDSLTAVQLTVDLKPDLPVYYQAAGGEKKRRVFGLGSEAKGYYRQTLCVSYGKKSSSASHELCLAFAIFRIMDDVGCFKDSWLMFGTMNVLDTIMCLDVAMFGIVDV